MKKIIILLGFLISLDSMGDCIYPKRNFDIPPGWNTSQREMLTSMQDVKDYQKDLGRYRDCINDELARISRYHQNLDGNVVAIIIMALAAAEAAIFLSAIILLFKTKGKLDANLFAQLRQGGRQK